MEVIAHILFPLIIPPPHIFESAQTVPVVITFAPLIWSEEHIAPTTESLHPGVVVPIPTLPPLAILILSPLVPSLNEIYPLVAPTFNPKA
jgi:hypothetical protein